MIPAAELCEQGATRTFNVWHRQKPTNLELLLRATVFYSGRVQGVGFRYTVKRLVCGFDVSGFVENLPSGQVRLVVEGDKNELEAFILAVGDSGLGPMIRGHEVFWSDSTGEYRGFDIVR